MKNFVQNNINAKKIRQDKISKYLSLSLAWFFSLVFFCLIIFIIIASIPGIEHYGIINILFTSVFDIQNNKASIWMPFSITIITAGLAILLAGPIGIKTAVFIKYRIPKKYEKPIRISVELLANIPSVIFGLFAAEILGVFIKNTLNIDTAYSLLTAGVMLTFMIIPTVVSLSINALDGCDVTLISAAMVLGNTKTRAIYRVCKKQASAGITVGVIIALTRAIGETMAVSMILQSQGYTQGFGEGFFGLFTSNLRTLGAFISANMFAEGGGPGLQGLLFTYGLILFLFVMLLNAIAIKMTKRKVKTNYSWWNKFENIITFYILFIPKQINMLWEKITYRSLVDKSDLSLYFATRTQKNKFIKSYSTWKKFWELVSITITFSFIIAIIVNIIGYGAVASVGTYTSIFSFVKDTTGQAFINTLLIITLAIGIGLPLSLMIAIYINEFAAESKNKKAIIFFIDSLGATPSILFGMFGLIFFIQTLGMSSNGAQGKSLIAGALTILIVILPTFIRTIQQALASVPVDLRTNSYALGCGKWETIKKVVLPTALQGVITSVILSIGRILAETAPLYLTSGLSSSNNISLDGAGQTLTTRIYAQIYEADIGKARSIMYECAFVTLLLVLLIIFFIHFLIPLYFKRKFQRSQIDFGSKKHKKKSNISKINNTKKFTKQKTKFIFKKINYNYIRGTNG